VLVGWDNELNLFINIQHRRGRFLVPCMSCLVGFEPGGAVARAATSKTAFRGDALLRRPARVLFQPLSLDSFEAPHEAADRLPKRQQSIVSHASCCFPCVRTHRIMPISRELNCNILTHPPKARGAITGVSGPEGDTLPPRLTRGSLSTYSFTAKFYSSHPNPDLLPYTHYNQLTPLNPGPPTTADE
jgi:hypothetical protein